MVRKQHVLKTKVVRQSEDVMVSVGTVDENRGRRALEAVGKFHSGVSDLATEHDKHLAETFKK